MVMNMDATSFNAITEYRLEPVIYSFELLQSFLNYLDEQGITDQPVHIEIETGMNRLGFAVTDIERLGQLLSNTNAIIVKSVFTHLAASEDEAQDAFTREQAGKYLAATEVLQKALGYTFLKHISNTAAILRFPEYQLDMVRAGIGLYGIETTDVDIDLLPVATLRSTVSQIKRLKAGDTVSYNRTGVVKEDSVIATVRIGYADGYTRRLGNGLGKMWVKGQLVPVIGTVCMDMTMLDVSGVPGVEVGDDVIVFGAELPVQQVAEWAGTIPYEILTSISQRVKRVYFQE
jgi:alanine racemase